VLDASQLSLVFEVSKAAERGRQAPPALPSRDAPTQVLPKDGRATPAPVETRVVAGKDPRTPIFVTVIVGLVVLLLMLAFALFVISRKVQQGQPAAAEIVLPVDVDAVRPT